MTQRVNGKRVGLFLALTFSLSWGFEWLVARTIGQAAYLETGMHPLGMFFPAFSALILQLFAFKDSPIYYRTYQAKPRWILYSFLLLTVLISLITLLALTSSIRVLVLQGGGAILVMLWTMLVLFLYGSCQADDLKRAGLQLGDNNLAVRFIAGVVVFLLLQSALNGLFGLGSFPGIQARVGGVAVPGGWHPLALIVFFLISVIGTPLAGLAVVIGEEYGWRGFLQAELVKLGRLPGVLLTGLIWGIWHFPIILSGVHTYPATAIGLLLGAIFFTLAGVIFGYAVLKTGSIWVAAFMHGVLNSIYAFGLNYLVRPADKLFSFGLGTFGLICLAGVVLAVLRDPIWRQPAEQSA